MTCPQCGKESESTRYCTECGASFRKPKGEVSERTPHQPAHTAPSGFEEISAVPAKAEEGGRAEIRTELQTPNVANLWASATDTPPEPTVPHESVREAKRIIDPAPVEAQEPFETEPPNGMITEHPTGGKSRLGLVLIPAIVVAGMTAWWQLGRARPQPPASGTPVVVKPTQSPTPAIDPTPKVAPSVSSASSEVDLKTIAAAMLGYVRSRDGRLELVTASMPKLIAPYVGDEKIFSRDGTAYSFNDSLSGLKLDQVREPEKTVLVYVGKDGQLDFKDGKTWVAFVNGDVREVTQEERAELNWKVAAEAAPEPPNVPIESSDGQVDPVMDMARLLRTTDLLEALSREQSGEVLQGDESKLADLFKGSTPRQLWFAKNALYASYGYKFQSSAELRDYFGKASWYRPTNITSESIDRKMTSVEKKNAWRLGKLVRFLQGIKDKDFFDSRPFGGSNILNVVHILEDAPLPP